MRGSGEQPGIFQGSKGFLNKSIPINIPSTTYERETPQENTSKVFLLDTFKVKYSCQLPL